LLSKWNVDFDGVNVLGNPTAQQELKALGVPVVPATVLGERVVHGWNPAALAELVGVPYDGAIALNPTELGQSLDNLLYYNQQVIRKVPQNKLASLKNPDRPRVLRDLAYHVFRLSVAFVDTMEEGYFPEAWLLEDAPEGMNTGEDIAAYGERVRARIREWIAAAPEEIFQQLCKTYYGEQITHEFLERTAWHAGQHLRQVYNLLEEDGFLPQGSLPEAVFEGLPMPTELW
jgi:hypothetical protein